MQVLDDGQALIQSAAVERWGADGVDVMKKSGIRTGLACALLELAGGVGIIEKACGLSEWIGGCGAGQGGAFEEAGRDVVTE